MHKSVNSGTMKIKLLVIFVTVLFSLRLLSQAPPWQWARQGASGGSEIALDVCTDATSTNIYACGSFDGNLNSVYGSSMSVAQGQSDGLVLKYDAGGTLLWAFSIGGAGAEDIRGITTDPLGDVYIIGSFNGTCDFDPSAATFNLISSGRDGFLAKYNPSGTFQWAVKFGGASTDNVWGIYADANGIYVTGYYTGIAAFNSTSGPQNIISAQGNEDLFGIKYNVSGVVQWIISQGDSETDMGYEVIADNNNVYFIGSYDENIKLYNANGNLAASRVSEQNNKSSVIISAYSQAGVLQWANNISSTDDNLGLGITQDAGNIYVTGSISSNAHFQYPNPSFTVASSATDIFLAKLSKSSGVFTWVSAQTGSGSGNESGYDIELNYNTLVVFGAYNGTLNYQPFGGTSISSNNNDIFLTCFDLSGNYLWTAPASGVGSDIPAGLALNTTGGIFVSGAYSSGIAFGSTSLTGAGNSNIFVAKIGCDSILSNFTVPSTQTICAGNSPSVITGSVSAGLNYSVQWQMSTNAVNWTNASGTATNVSYSPPTLTTSTYFRRVISAAATCTNFSNGPSAFVSVDQIPVSDPGPDQFVCIKTPSTTLAAVSPTSGTGVWSVISGSATLNTPTLANTGVTNLTIGNTVFQWLVSSGVCPATSSEMTITVVDVASPAVVGANQTICSNTTMLSAISPSSGTGFWTVLSGTGSVAAIAIPSTMVSGVGTGTNSFLWTVSNGVCPPSYDTLFVVVDAMPANAYASVDQTICIASATMGAISTTIGSGWWNVVSGSGIFLDSTVNNTRIDSLAPGKNVFRWSVVNGVCPQTFDEVNVWRELPPDSVFAGSDQRVEIPVADLSATTPSLGIGYWQILQGSGIFEDDSSAITRITGLAQGDNRLRWSVKKGVCPVTTSDLVIYLEPLKIPNGFSPNGDGINDTFTIPGVDYYEHAELSVFNRWGGMVYHNLSYKNDWIGTSMNLEPLVDDTYFFTLIISSDMNFKGFVIIKTSK